MSFLTEQKTEIAQAQVTEALLRMKKLKLHENVIKDFLENGKLNQSEVCGLLYWLNEDCLRTSNAGRKAPQNISYGHDCLER